MVRRRQKEGLRTAVGEQYLPRLHACVFGNRLPGGAVVRFGVAAQPSQALGQVAGYPAGRAQRVQVGADIFQRVVGRQAKALQQRGGLATVAWPMVEG